MEQAKTSTLEQFDGDEKRFRGAIDFIEDLASDVEQRYDANRRVNDITVNVSAKEREALAEE